MKKDTFGNVVVVVICRCWWTGTPGQLRWLEHSSSIPGVVGLNPNTGMPEKMGNGSMP